MNLENWQNMRMVEWRKTSLFCRNNFAFLKEFHDDRLISFHKDHIYMYLPRSPDLTRLFLAPDLLTLKNTIFKQSLDTTEDIKLKMMCDSVEVFTRVFENMKPIEVGYQHFQKFL